MVVLDIDKPLGHGFQLRVLKTPGYTGAAGDGLLSLAGFSGTDNIDQGTIELFIVNHRPSVGAETGEFLDHSAVGGNSTIELFETGPDATELRHLHTYVSKHIATPDRVAAVGRDSFYFTNDHGPNKLGLVSDDNQYYWTSLIQIATPPLTYPPHRGCDILRQGRL